MDNIIITEEEKEKRKVMNEKNASLFYDLAKLTFGASVLGGIIPMFENASWFHILFVIIGGLVTLAFGMIGNNFLK